DRDLADIFALQDEVIGKIVEALVGRLAATQIPKRSRAVKLEAYDLCVRARTIAGQTLQAQKEARLMLQRAIEIDPHYAGAHRWLALDLQGGWRSGGEPDEASLHMAVTTAERAVALDPNDAGNRWVLGYLLANERRWSESDAELAAALTLDP